jgi:hypothetical protein
MYGSRWGTSGAVCATGSGRILLSAPPASSFQTVRFSIGAFTGRSAEQKQWRRLLWALTGSLLLHWGVWAVLRPGAGAVGPGLGRSTVFATLRSTARAAPPAAIEAPGDEILAASADAPSTHVAESEPALPPEPAESADATSLLATLGQQRLEAQLPPYLVAPLAIGASLGPWYFPRSELTVAPKLLDEPLIPQPEKPGTTGQRLQTRSKLCSRQRKAVTFSSAPSTWSTFLRSPADRRSTTAVPGTRSFPRVPRRRR